MDGWAIGRALKRALRGARRIGVYPGQYFDAESGLHYNKHRYFDPIIGRYFKVDPIGFEGGLNFYIYSMNNPITHIDPKGLKDMIDGYRRFYGKPWYDRFPDRIENDKCITCDTAALKTCLENAIDEKVGNDCAECKLTGDFYSCRKCEGAAIWASLCFSKHCKIDKCKEGCNK